MPIYRITENNVTVAEYEADTVTMLANGQFVISKNDTFIAIFNQNCSCFSIDDIYKTQFEIILSEISEMRKNISEIDKDFGNDIFLKGKTPEEAYEKLRKIARLVCFHSNNLTP